MWLKFGILSALGLNMKNWKNTQVTIVTDIVAKGLVQLPSNIRDWHQSRSRNISHCTRFQPLYETSNTIFVTGHWRILSITHTLIWIRLTLEDELVGIKSESQWSDYGEVFFSAIVEKVVSENVFNSYTEHIVSLSNAFLRSNKSFICNPSYSNAFRTFLFVLSEHLSTRLFVGSKDSSRIYYCLHI